MLVAFTACTSVRLVKNQPVWTDILSYQPDHVILLGDNIYSDVPDPGIDALQKMNTLEFAEHLWLRYAEQLAQPQFAQLVRANNIQLHAIWDDHDFAWDNAAGGQLLAQPGQREKIYISTSLMRAFRKVLAAHDPTLFPQSVNAAVVWANSPPHPFVPLGAYSIPLENNGRCWLHLTDGRTWRDKPDLLGAAQRNYLSQQFSAAPEALHIIASGSTFNGSGGWSRYSEDLLWLDKQLGDKTWLLLSGDIHRNALVQHALSRGNLVEATASGAALYANLNPWIKGELLKNFGLLTLLDQSVQVQLLALNQSALQGQWSRYASGGLVAN